MAIYNVHAGHNPKGKIACGAVGLLDESEQDRIIKDKVILFLRENGHTVYDCTVDNGTSKSDVLQKIIQKCNSHNVDLDISIHLNSGANDKIGNGKSTGTEVWIYNNSSKTKPVAQAIVNKIASLGFKNRGVKSTASLYFLRKAKAPAILIETLFCDDADDVRIYNADKMAKAIVEGILGNDISSITTTPSQPVKSQSTDEVTPNKSFKIRVKVSTLNIRKSPSTSSAVVGKITDNGIYTITEVSGNWGKLKSGAGWISIAPAYVTKL